MLVSRLLTGIRASKRLYCYFQNQTNRLFVGNKTQIANPKISFQTQAKANQIMATSEAEKLSNANSSEDDLLKELCNLAINSMNVSTKRDHLVVDFKTPNELGSIIDFNIDGKAKDHSTIKELCKSAIQYSSISAHPRFFNQQYGGISKYGFGADVVATSINANAHTFEIAPVFVMAEKAVLEKARQIFGYEGGDGTFCPGGSYSCMLAMNLAKYEKCPDVKNKGLFGNPPLVLFVSEQGHYSAIKNAMLLGLGSDNCIKVACDDKGKMISSELEKEIRKSEEKGSIPFFVIATAGSTVLGSFDHFHEVANICKKHDLWMHIDACWGGSVMLSNRHKHLCDGISRANSIAWNPHKMLMIPHQCSLLLLQEEGLLKKYNTTSAPYLFQPDKPYDTDYDIGSKLIQCGRRVDAFKLWIAWKANGDFGFEKQVDLAVDNANYFLQQIKKREDFRLVIPEPEYTNVSFWYIPPSLRNQEEDKSFWEKLHLVAPTIKTRMQKAGTMLIGYQPLGTKVNFFRIVLVNSAVTHEDLDFVLDEIERLGKDL